MNKQALLTAISDCRKRIDKGLGPNHAMTNRGLIEEGAFGLHIIETLLSDDACRPEPELHIIQMDAADLPEKLKTMLNKMNEMETHKPGSCPRCGNEEFSPGAKFCRICGMAIMESKEGQPCNHQH